MNYIRLYYFLGVVVLIVSVITINIGIYFDNVYLVVCGVICFFTAILRLVYVSILIEEEERQPLLIPLLARLNI